MNRHGSLGDLLCERHRALDDLFGRYLAALDAEAWEAASEALLSFDGAFRAHAAWEEQHLLGPLGEKSQELQAQTRDLRLEHTQIRELLSISRVKLRQSQFADLQALSTNLARRFARHEEREEAHFFPLAEQELSGEERAEAIATFLSSSP